MSRVIPPAEGERRAQRGYGRQYESAAAAIYAALDRGELLWVGLADRSAGIADDVVLGFAGKVVGHQFKTSQFPEKFTLGTLLMGANGLLKPLAAAWKSLKSTNPGERIEICLVTNDYPSTTDTVSTDSSPAHSAAFLEEFQENSNRSLAEWRNTTWGPFVETLFRESGLDEREFEQFLRAFRLLHGSAADFVQLHRLSAEAARLAREIAALLPRLVADPRNRDRWTRAELLRELNWRDSAVTRHAHRFPVGAYVQRNVDTEEALRRSIRSATHGYVSLVGPPGAGKSTLLQTALATEGGLLVVRYLAYVPGAGQGIGRGEADDFFDDVSAQLKNSGLAGVRIRNETLDERREHFAALLRQAGERYEKEHVSTLVVVDGLDHVPREERPQRSFLEELPLPESIPKGVLFVLGTQRVDLPDLKPSVRDQAGDPDRMVPVTPLKAEAVHRMADLLDLDASVPRERVFELSRGHPLVTRYLIESLRDADTAQRAAILAGSVPFEGDLEAVYESAWRGIKDDEDARTVLGYMARVEGSIPLELLARAIPEPAIERALKATRHLLVESKFGWSIFHNSFRLFILDKPRIRLGKPDPGYSSEVYRDLARLAQVAPADTPQRWLELRYLARAGDNARVLELARPVRFRNQLAEGRPVSELEADIRLALRAAQGTQDATTVVRLLLARDEMGRRSGALNETTSLTDALLAVGDVNAAQAFAEEYGTQGYHVVDALLNVGERARAKDLFDRLEPIQQLLSGRLNTSNVNQNRSDFAEWARRVFHFRDIEQINREIDRLSSAGLGPVVSDREDAEKRLAVDLRQTVAFSMVAAQPEADPEQVTRQIGLESDATPELLTYASLRAHVHGSTALAITLLRRALAHEHFGKASNSTRRRAALISARAGELDIAHSIFASLTVPSISELDDEFDDKAPEHMARAVLEYAELATLLGRPIPTMPQSRRAILHALQGHANAIGVLLGRARTAAEGIFPGDVARAAKAALAYLARAKARGSDEFFAMRQIATATPVLGRALIRAAALCGKGEFELVVTEFENAFAAQNGNTTIFPGLRREIAVAIYRNDGDTSAASRRLEPLVTALHESTPSAQLDGLGELALAFAAVGNYARARDLLGQVHDTSLGYALAPKKDPQYATWRELLIRANAAHPDGRDERVALLMRQLSGMAETEGRSAAYRIASTLLEEAAMCDAATGLAAARALSDQNMIGWPNLVDALLLGTIRRRPDLATACSVVWCSLALPYYMEPHSESRLGEFVEAAVSLVDTNGLDNLVELFRTAIEAESRVHERAALLSKLDSSAQKRGHVSGRLRDAVSRWAPEAPPPRRSSTPDKYDSIMSLSDLEDAFNESGGDLGYEAPRAFDRLAPDAGFEAARRVFERWPVVQENSRSRFLLVDLALGAGEREYAKRLVADYESLRDDWATWTAWSGGGKLRYFRAKVKLNGASGHAEAFEDFVASISAGREIHMSVMLELEDILPVISVAPDWRAIWELLAEQLTTTREHSLGKPFGVVDRAIGDVDSIAELFLWALSIPLAELQRHAYVGLEQLNLLPAGHPVFARVVRTMLSGEGDEPALGLQLLLFDTEDSMSAELRDVVPALVNHRDYAVEEAAVNLSNRWGLPTPIPQEPLPAFYKLALQDQEEDFEQPTLADRDSGAMLVESPLGWTSMFPLQVRALARSSITPAHIRHRCRMFIEKWGGLDAFGRSATERIQSELARLEMRMPYWRPHVMVAARALRYVAAELRRGGVVQEADAPFLLHALNFPAPTLPLITPLARPRFVARPGRDETSWQSAEIAEKWLQGVESDVAPAWPQDETVIAEISTFEVHEVSRGRYRSARVRAPFLVARDGTGFGEWIDLIPEAVWADGFQTSTNQLSPTIVRRLTVRYMPEIPQYQLILCPNWMRALGWRMHPDNWLVYIDRSGQVVARLMWWRDGGPVDLEDDTIWGEGFYVSVTASGLSQIEAIRGSLTIWTYARREVLPLRDNGEPMSRSASRQD